MSVRLLLAVSIVAGVPAVLGAQTFSNTTAITLTDSMAGSPYPSAITVSGVSGTIGAVTVSLKGIQHSWPDDIDVALVGPNGACSLIMSDVGGDQALTGVDVTLYDAAAVALPDSTAITAGTYRPTNFGSVDGFPAPGPATDSCSSTLQHFSGQNANGVWKLYVVDDEPDDVGAIAGGWTLTFSTAGGDLDTDLDGDSRSDMTVWRPSNGVWYTRTSSTGFSGVTAEAWGTMGDIPVPADFDGDGRMDRAVFRPSTGAWYIQQSTGGSVVLTWGSQNDVPVPADFDGDSRADIAVWRPSNGVWYVRTSSTSYAGGFTVHFGTNNDIPTPGDYDGDGIDDVAVFRPSSGTWYVRRSTDLATAVITWGMAGDIPVPGRYDSDAITDIAVWRPSTGVWWIRNSATGTVTSTRFGDGALNDVPVAGDFDGDGRFDLAVFRRNNGVWYVQLSSGGTLIQPWGLSTDTPTRER